MVAEELLHFIWQFRLFDQLELYSTDGEQIRIIQVGQCNTDAGPDFLLSEIDIGGQTWRGHVEIHIDGASWTAHGHHLDKAYNSVVLHVVYRNPTPVFRADGTPIPCLELAQLIPETLMQRYRAVMENLHWIPCEKQLPKVNSLSKRQVLQRMTTARLEYRYQQIRDLLQETVEDWEKTLFLQLCRSFGMRVNAVPFLELGRLLNLPLIWKYRNDSLKLEAMAFGQAGFLSEVPQAGYTKMLADEYRYLKGIHGLKELEGVEWKFMRMRPYSFPTFRLAQLIGLYRHTPYLFEALIRDGKRSLFDNRLKGISVSPFWETHFVLGKSTPPHGTRLSPVFLEHIAINALIPLLFSYGKNMGLEHLQARALQWLEELNAEKNNITRNFKALAFPALSAADSQALLQLKKDYCDQKKCLRCPIGLSLFKSAFALHKN